jgi:hypothetical protein
MRGRITYITHTGQKHGEVYIHYLGVALETGGQRQFLVLGNHWEWPAGFGRKAQIAFEVRFNEHLEDDEAFGFRVI